jgi:hypothetical protein
MKRAQRPRLAPFRMLWHANSRALHSAPGEQRKALP